ncbi:ArsR/SmtB family transcription factor [Arthrobacter sp. CDRTa11]|uniref:ArsR/SmtB family transcription factor n=1 Tax=Arthrobacter sp. CDRTa11 TaxID=2651199 RepID=UPI002265D23C|nr:winged helix-turn-helix domain-containing protein [Arthrobacter sp. CDRTa11]
MPSEPAPLTSSLAVEWDGGAARGSAATSGNFEQVTGATFIEIAAIKERNMSRIGKSIPWEQSWKVDSEFLAVSNLDRQLILRQLSTGPKSGKDLCELIGDISQPEMSRHLKILVEARLVTAARVPKKATILYTYQDEMVMEMIDSLSRLNEPRYTRIKAKMDARKARLSDSV